MTSMDWWSWIVQILRDFLLPLWPLLWSTIMNMKEPAAPPVYLSTVQVARRLSCEAWMVSQLFVRRILPEPPRFNRRRMIREVDLPTIEEALRKAGYRK